MDIKVIHSAQIKNLRQYFHQRAQNSSLHLNISEADNMYSPLNLRAANLQTNDDTQTMQAKINQWKSMSLHGRHPQDLSRSYVDKEASNAWLRRGILFPETEGFMLAIQDQVVGTKNYQRYIVKSVQAADDRCRKCREQSETIQHITGGCSALAQSDYLYRHNQVANIVHQELAFKCNLVKDKLPYYKYKPSPVLESASFTLYYDRSIITDRAVHNNRPDIVLLSKFGKKAYLIDIAVPNTHNIEKTIAEKHRKYTELKDEVQRLWNMDNVYIVPIVLSATGIIPRSLHHSLSLLELKAGIYVCLQKAVILSTTRIVRRFMSIDC